MAKSVTVTRPHKTTKEAALEKLKALGQDAATRYGVTVAPHANGAQVEGRGITGSCKVDDRNIIVDLELPFLLRAIAGRVESGIHSAIDKHFG